MTEYVDGDSSSKEASPARMFSSTSAVRGSVAPTSGVIRTCAAAPSSDIPMTCALVTPSMPWMWAAAWPWIMGSCAGSTSAESPASTSATVGALRPGPKASSIIS